MGAPPTAGGYLNAPNPMGTQGGSHAVAKKRTVVPRTIANYTAGGETTAQVAYARITNPSGRLLVGMSVCFEAANGESLAFGTSTWQARAGRKNNQSGQVGWGPNIFPAARTLPDAWSFEDSTEEVMLTFALANQDFGSVAGALVLQVTFEATSDMSPQEADSLLAQVDVVVGGKAPNVGCDNQVTEENDFFSIQAGAKTPITITFGSAVILRSSNTGPFPCSETGVSSTYVTDGGVTKAGTWNHTLDVTSAVTWIFTPTDNWSGAEAGLGLAWNTGMCSQCETDTYCVSQPGTPVLTSDAGDEVLTWADNPVKLNVLLIEQLTGIGAPQSITGTLSPTIGSEFSDEWTFTPSSPFATGNYTASWAINTGLCGADEGTTPFTIAT